MIYCICIEVWTLAYCRVRYLNSQGTIIAINSNQIGSSFKMFKLKRKKMF